MIISVLLITLAGAFTSCVARKDGAPQEACSNLLPKHSDIKPQQVSSPYTVSTKSLGNNKIGVMISSSAGKTFKGFILQARSAYNREKFIPGEFSISSISKGINCEDHEKSTLTHVNNEPKTEVSTEWTGRFDEDIIFRATVVEEYQTFWINIDSDPITVREKELDKKNQNDCKGSDVCVEAPTNCVVEGNCKILLEYKDNGDETIQFTLSGELKDSQYIAMGISEDGRMGEDFVTECLNVGSSEIELRKSWNQGKHNVDTRLLDSVNTSITFINGRATCIWNETKIVNFNDTAYDLSNKPYILLARGEVRADGSLGYHHKSKVASSEPIDLFASGYFYFEGSGNKKPTEGEPDGNQTTEPSPSKSKSTDAPNSCSQLNFGLFWLAFLGVFYASGRNLLNLI